MIVQVESVWKHTQIVVIPYKQGKDTILGNNDEMITKIDDNLMVVNNILASKYVAPLKTRVQTQVKMLRYVQ